MSSYRALDVLLQYLRDALPTLSAITVAGHSAGGQLVQRYAAVGVAPGEDDLAYRFVVANPSSYAYFDGRRPSGDSFLVPDDPECAWYDEWPYGLRDPNAYASPRVGSALPRIQGRDVRILLGTADTGDVNLDTTCAASLQGEHRYARGLSYVAHIAELGPSAHELTTVDGAEHSRSQMFLSDPGLAALFVRAD